MRIRSNQQQAILGDAAQQPLSRIDNAHSRQTEIGKNNRASGKTNINQTIANLFGVRSDTSSATTEKQGLRVDREAVSREFRVNIPGRGRMFDVPLTVKYDLHRSPAPNSEKTSAENSQRSTTLTELREARKDLNAARTEAATARQNAQTPDEQQRATELEQRVERLEGRVKRLENRMANLDAQAERKAGKVLNNIAPELAFSTVGTVVDEKGKTSIVSGESFKVKSFKVGDQWYTIKAQAVPPAAPKALSAEQARESITSDRQTEFNSEWRDQRREMVNANKTSATTGVIIGDQNYSLQTTVKYATSVEEKRVLPQNEGPLSRAEARELHRSSTTAISQMRRESANTGAENLTRTIKLSSGREFTVSLKADWQAELKSNGRRYDVDDAATQRPAERYQINNAQDLPKFSVTDEEVQNKIKNSKDLPFNHPYVRWRDFARTHVTDQQIQNVKAAFRIALFESGDSKISQMVPIGSERYTITVEVNWDVKVKPAKEDLTNEFTNADRQMLAENDYKFTDEQWKKLNDNAQERANFLAELNKNPEKLREMRQEMVDQVIKDGKKAVAEKGLDIDGTNRGSIKTTRILLGQEYNFSVGADWSGEVKKHYESFGDVATGILDVVMPVVGLIPGGQAIAAAYGVIRSATQKDYFGAAMNLVGFGTAAGVFKGSAAIAVNAMRQIATGFRTIFDPNARGFDKILAGFSVAVAGLRAAGNAQNKAAFDNGSLTGSESGMRLLDIADKINTISSIASSADIVLRPGMRDFDRIIGGLGAISGSLRLIGGADNIKLADTIDTVNLYARRGDQLVTGNLAPLFQDIAGWAIQEAAEKNQNNNNVVPNNDNSGGNKVALDVTPRDNFDPAAIMKDRLVTGKSDFDGKQRHDFKFVERNGDLVLKSGRFESGVDVRLGKLIVGSGDDQMVFKVKKDKLIGEADGKRVDFKPNKGQMNLINNELSKQNGGFQQQHPTFFDPFRGISRERQQSLDNRALGLINRYNADNSLSFTDFGNMLNDINELNLNTQEKANIWTVIANTIGSGGYNIQYHDLPRNLRDSFRPQTSAGHIIIGFNDGYHGDLAQDSPDVAARRMVDHETREGGIVGMVGRLVFSAPFIGELAAGISGGQFTASDGFINYGDLEASARQVRALRAFRNGGFAAYAREWNRLFLNR